MRVYLFQKFHCLAIRLALTKPQEAMRRRRIVQHQSEDLRAEELCHVHPRYVARLSHTLRTARRAHTPVARLRPRGRPVVTSSRYGIFRGKVFVERCFGYRPEGSRAGERRKRRCDGWRVYDDVWCALIGAQGGEGLDDLIHVLGTSCGRIGRHFGFRGQCDPGIDLEDEIRVFPRFSGTGGQS